MKPHIITTVLISLLLYTTISCTEKDNTNKIPGIVSSYYDAYQKRNDFEKFLGFYDENIVLEDIISGDRIIGKDSLQAFFDWENPNFNKTNPATLIITEQIIKGEKVITKGYFTAFTWNEYSFEAMHFTTILTFNASGKIIKQVDWINYPSNLLNYHQRKNANEWINDNDESDFKK